MSRLPFYDPPPAIVHGYAARALAIYLRSAWERGEFSALPADGREDVRLTISAIAHAGEAWYRRRPSAHGSAEAFAPEMQAPSDHDVFLTVDEAAGLLGLTPRRVRSLAAAGLGVKVGGVWMLDAEQVELEAKRRAAA